MPLVRIRRLRTHVPLPNAFAHVVRAVNPFWAWPDLQPDPWSLEPWAGDDSSRLFPASQTLARYNSPGGANHVTSACSPLIYRDSLLGPGYAGNAFTCEPVHNLVRRLVLEPDGVTFG